MPTPPVRTDVIVIGAGLAGLVAAAEAADAGRRVVILDQEVAASLGGQAYWSLGGLFLVNSPEQRRLGITDSAELALSDWLGTAGFDRAEDHWPREWAKAYVEFASGEKRSWLKEQGVSLFPVVQWAERGGYQGSSHGNSVPRFHLVWGTGPGIILPFLKRVMKHVRTGRIELRFRHRVTELLTADGGVVGARGEILAPDNATRGRASNRDVVSEFSLVSGAVVVSSGGIGGNHDLVRANWPAGFGSPPEHLITGVPASTDGLMLGVAERAGGRQINSDRMWHYPEGVIDHTPVWPNHGIRILSGPSAMWLDARGHRLPAPLWPGFDSLGTVRHITRTGFSHSWFLLNQATIGPEFSLSGSEQNLDLTGRSLRLLLKNRLGDTPIQSVQAFQEKGVDFLTDPDLRGLVAKMNALVGEDLIDPELVAEQLRIRDLQVATGLGKDPQLVAVEGARRYFGDRKMRTAAPHAFADPAAGPLVAVRLHVLTRKSLGGLETDLSARALGVDGQPVPGLYAAGEAAGFGGGGVHGYRALEGTFLGGCLFSGRIAGRAAAAATA
ncbi:FAD-binding dehydrogenase [Nakamurella antarctica]|uniref:FAD-binding dehydrogenase n=1 Tax=Nakamurella antarctica TaxID=1902245 RepID=A0A3G8ZIL4_9ACTN|nr:FAD-binding dehydrogenase [Nakamurella antarctica]AZI57018.1 FAD-binding dehydrogenase [Nakamurella antarctica]